MVTVHYIKPTLSVRIKNDSIAHVFKFQKPKPIDKIIEWNIWDCKRFNLETTGKQ